MRAPKCTVVSAAPFDRLQVWYLAQCDGDWEHRHGVTIGTLDNPGWSLRIDSKTRCSTLVDPTFACTHGRGPKVANVSRICDVLAVGDQGGRSIAEHEVPRAAVVLRQIPEAASVQLTNDGRRDIPRVARPGLWRVKWPPPAAGAEDLHSRSGSDAASHLEGVRARTRP
jgi:Immunity protein 53